MPDPVDQPDPPEAERRHTKRVDLTINIPTVIMIATLIVSSSAWAIGIYADIEKRQLMTDVAVTSLSQRIDRVENNISNVKSEQTAASANLRADMKAETTEIKAMLNQLIFPSHSASQRRLKEWSKD